MILWYPHIPISFCSIVIFHDLAHGFLPFVVHFFGGWNLWTQAKKELENEVAIRPHLETTFSSPSLEDSHCHSWMPRTHTRHRRIFWGVISESPLGAPSVSKELFLSMDHPRVARLMDVYESEGRLSLVMECMEGCEGCRAGGWWCRRWPKHQCHTLCEGDCSVDIPIWAMVNTHG